MKPNFFQRHTIKAFIAEHSLPETCFDDLFHATVDQLNENKDEKTNAGYLNDWLDAHENLKGKASKPINKAMERAAFGPGFTLAARAALRVEYGDVLYDTRQTAWNAASETKPGTDPDGSDQDTIEKAAAKNSPFNPANKIKDREAAIAKFIAQCGTKAALAECRKFSVDLAGRPTTYKTH
jgi:hypothetical protein